MKIDEHFSIPCPECGGIEFELPDGADDESFVKCTQCGFGALLADIREHGIQKAKEHVTEQARREIEKQIRKIFK